MTHLARISPLPPRTSPHRNAGGWRHAGAWLAAIATGAAAFGIWAMLNRPATNIPAYRGEIGGFAFSPFRAGQSPQSGVYPSVAQIRSDLALVAKHTHDIRTYTVEGDLGQIPALAAPYHLNVTLGAWLDQHTKANEAELKKVVKIANANADVKSVMVGNEVILRRNLTVPELAADIRYVKQRVHVPVSTAEPWHVWLHHPELAKSVDFITVHLLPYWEGVPEKDAVNYALMRLHEVEKRFPGKKVVIGEIGWPSDGIDIGAARASRVLQARFLRDFFNIAQKQHLDYFVMEAFDQPWKTSFEGRAAGYWGMWSLNRQAKWSLSGPVQQNRAWLAWALGSTLLGALLTLLMLRTRPDLRWQGKLLFAGLVQGFGAALAALLMTMGETYLSWSAAAVWATLAAGQALLLVLLVADSFDLVETLFGRVRLRHYEPVPAPQGTKLPKVSLHVAICNEPPEMVKQTLNALAALDYGNFEVLVIDNNTKDPAVWEPVAAHCARLGEQFRFFTLGQYPGYKAGALNFALRETAPDAEIIGVIDSDYIVDPDWLRCMVPAFADPKVGFTQSPQDYRDNDGSLFKRMMFWEYAGFFHIGMVNRNERNAVIQHGTMTLIRKAALDAEGGWAEWCITEDSELGLRLFRKGFEAVYSKRSFGRGVMPDDFNAFRKQRYRWAYGAMRISREHWKAFLSPFDRTLTIGQRWHFVTGWLPWIGDALGLAFVLLGLAWSAGLILDPVRFEFPIILFMLPSIGLFAFKIVQIFALYAARVPCGRADRLGAAVAGLALSHSIGKAVWKGLFTDRLPFIRTAKMENAPALVQGLFMVREELVLLALTWGALLGVGFSHHWATPECRLWCLVLLTQSLPYLASVSVSVIAALPGKTLHALPIRQPAILPRSRMPISARTAAGD
ncbi:MAG TPA: glycosyltransferase [Acidiphilium sp.]|uniref:glycosyltransferase n=1 Tax=unclassified Acidiphilium TaxID=2617493 RepID=UPI000BD99C45|nr:MULTISPECIES: glycosyltransferase [unclassified Acidiphilium]OYV57096.1 MAG: glycosyl transferase [Acidiphilium sp. 20-67-58]HQT60703.1 glycosyltransferase [Acidiphilium sp.]HQU11304.1 glycosyltransferase [Acidiphilium sp.]